MRGGWACTPDPHQAGLIFPSWCNVRQKEAIATLCVPCGSNPYIVYILYWRKQNRSRLHCTSGYLRIDIFGNIVCEYDTYIHWKPIHLPPTTARVLNPNICMQSAVLPTNNWQTYGDCIFSTFIYINMLCYCLAYWKWINLCWSVVLWIFVAETN
jgi:hypothetical protein